MKPEPQMNSIVFSLGGLAKFACGPADRRPQNGPTIPDSSPSYSKDLLSRFFSALVQKGHVLGQMLVQ